LFHIRGDATKARVGTIAAPRAFTFHICTAFAFVKYDFTFGLCHEECSYRRIFNILFFFLGLILDLLFIYPKHTYPCIIVFFFFLLLRRLLAARSAFLFIGVLSIFIFIILNKYEVLFVRVSILLDA